MSKINRHLDNSMPILERLAKIKKLFSSSATFWSVTRILMPFLISQFIALGWNQKFSSIAMEFVKDTPEWVQSIVLLIVGYFEKSGDWLFVWVVLFLIVLMVFVKLIEKEENTKHGFFFFSSFLLIGMTFWFYFLPQNEYLAKENSKKLEEIHQDKKVNNYLVDEVKLEREKYAQLKHEYDALRESVREIVPDDREIIDNANKKLEKEGIKVAIHYLQVEFSSLKVSKKQKEIEANQEISIDKKEPKSIATSKWITPSNSVCKSNNGKILSDNSCIATWKDANNICNDSGRKLPLREDFYKIIGDCGGIANPNSDGLIKNVNNSDYQFCYKEKRFKESWYWTSEEYDFTNAWSVYFHYGVAFRNNESQLYYVLCLR